MEDHELLRRYVESGSHEAFGELVRRHIGIVRGAALRLTRDRDRADDVTQAVFVALARDARKVRRGERTLELEPCEQGQQTCPYATFEEIRHSAATQTHHQLTTK